MSGYIGPQPVPQATQTREAFTATSGQTTFNTGGYTAGYIDVFLNGVKLAAADYTATNGSDVVLATGAATGDILETVAYTAFTVADQDFTGDLTVDGSTFVVDSTNNRVGVGTSSPSVPLHIEALSNSGTGTPTEVLRLQVTEAPEDSNLAAGDGTKMSFYVPEGNQTTQEGAAISAVRESGTDTDAKTALTFSTAADDAAISERMRITSDGLVGVGYTIPDEKLGVNGFLGLVGSQGTTPPSNNPSIARINSSNVMGFFSGGLERMRISGIGNLLVGTTNDNVYNTTGDQGIAIKGSSNNIQVQRDSGTCYFANRTGTDGTLMQFYKNGSAVGSIGVNSGNNLYISSHASDHAGLEFSFNSALPQRGGSSSDNTVDLGASSVRFDDVYATNGTIQTSDENEKQQIASLTDAEITAAKAISKLFKTFKWNDSVTEKGDAARTHAGVIAQQVETAMTDAGLTAGDYAFFISTTWWETQTEFPAVEADEENGVEAQEAYTRTDTYDTAEEAPEGATERNRKGIRYPQLLSFVAAATEQRLASIETRLDVLEAE